jgi:hypothetical protein
MTYITELLERIQDGAISSKVPITELLRLCQVLGSRIGTDEVGAWVQNELNGYPVDAEIPEYRILCGLAQGHFIGPGGSGLRNATLPASNLPEELRHWAEKIDYRNPISALEALGGLDKNKNVHFGWPGDLVAHVQRDFYEHLALAQAWLSVSHIDCQNVVETVRNRVLTFVLEVSKRDADDSGADLKSSASTLNQSFHTIIYGSVGNLAQSAGKISQVSGIQPGDLSSLLSELARLGVSKQDLDDLDQAITSEPQTTPGRLAPKVSNWVGRVISNALSGIGTVAVASAKEIIPKLLENFYGL